MGRLQEDRFSETCKVRRLSAEDIGAIFQLCLGNDLFYAYCAARPTREQIESDLTLLPPDKGPEDKYYVGFFEGGRLIAVLDLIDGYPDAHTAFIGFFMVEKALQGKGLGSAVIGEVCAYLRQAGFRRIQLGIDRDNPQSNRFWRKNGFAPVKEIPQDGGVILLAEKVL